MHLGNQITGELCSPSGWSYLWLEPAHAIVVSSIIVGSLILAAWQVLAYPPLFQQDSSDREEEWGE